MLKSSVLPRSTRRQGLSGTSIYLESNLRMAAESSRACSTAQTCFSLLPSCAKENCGHTMTNANIQCFIYISLQSRFIEVIRMADPQPPFKGRRARLFNLIHKSLEPPENLLGQH